MSQPQNHLLKQDLNSPTATKKSPHTSQSSLLDSPIAQLLGFGTSSSQNVFLPQIPYINSSNIAKNASGNIPSSNSNNFLNNPPTFSETKEVNDNKSDETKNFNLRLHHFQPPPLLLPNHNLLQPQFIESPRTQEQEEFLDDFEFYPGESPSINNLNTFPKDNKNNNSFKYSNLNSSPSPRTSTFDRNHATVDIFNKSINSTTPNSNENHPINRLSSSPTLQKNCTNRNSNKNIINLNLVNSPKLKHYISSPFATQNSTFVNQKNSDCDDIEAKSIIFNEKSSPTPKTPTFSFDNNENDNSENLDTKTNNCMQLTNSSNFESNNNRIDFPQEPTTNSTSNSSSIRSIFSDSSRSMLKIENDISTLRKSLNEIQEKYKKRYKSEKEKCRKEIVSMIERHREELNAIDESNNGFSPNHPIVQTECKRSSRAWNKNRNSNRRIRISDSNSDNQPSYITKQPNSEFNKSKFNLDLVSLGNGSNKVLNCIGRTPPQSSTNVNDLFAASSLKVSRASGQPTIHKKYQPESVIHVRVRIPNKKEFLHLDNPKLMAVLKRQREEIIALNEETSMKLASIIEEGAEAIKQINDRISELSASKNGQNCTNFFAASDASSSSSSAPNAFVIDDNDEITKDEGNTIPTILPLYSTTTASKYSASSSSLSSSSLSSSSNLNVNFDQQKQNLNTNNKTKTDKQNIIPIYGKTRNTSQRLLRNIPH